MRALSLLALVAALTLTAVGASAQNALQQLVSPGKLAQAHAPYEAKCSLCHAAFDKSGQTRLCLDCHKAVAADIAARRGLHGRNPTAAGQCKACHSDHHGRAARIVTLNPAGFNHALTDYPLAGAHGRVACAQCHLPGRRFRDTPTACVACHRKDDAHKGGLGDACQSCHTEAGWKSVKFDHAATRFPLAGAHARVECDACHAGGRFKGTPTACVSCHAKNDVHRGSLGTDCSSCHGTASWGAAGRFDHARTGFALVGAHARTDCGSCHAGGRFKNTPTACVACHAKKDVHAGRFGTDCAACHRTQDWTSVRFDHDRTRFPLEGAHRTAQCNQCHTSPDKSVQPPLDCASCHRDKDVHQGALGPQCGQCHTAAAWKPARFDHDAQTRFRLEGAHAKATCVQCHAQAPRDFRQAGTCIDCHRKDDVHAGQEGAACGSCHNATSWKEQVFFDHGLARFPLIGKHASVACAGCHASQRFRDAPSGCVDCHKKDDRHEGRLGPDCAACHSPTGWGLWSFDHDARTRFLLTGAHAGLECEACHTAKAVARVRQSSECVSCHMADDAHRGSFGPDCGRCHTTETFKGAAVGQFRP